MSSSSRKDEQPTDDEAWLWDRAIVRDASGARDESELNFIFGVPCTGRMVKLCVDRWLSDGENADKKEGWVLLTTEVRSGYWRSLLSSAESSSFPVPQPHILTYATIGTLKAFCDGQLAQKRLLIADHAELLLQVHRYALPLVRKFGGRMLFTQHVDLAGLCDLLEFVVAEKHLEKTLPDMRKHASLPPSLSASQPQTWHSNVVSPATTWLWHFVVVLFMYANVSRLSSWWSSAKSALASVTRKAPGMVGGGAVFADGVLRKRTLRSHTGNASHIKRRHTVRAQVNTCSRRQDRRQDRHKSRRLSRAGGGLTQRVVEGSSDMIVNMIVQVIKGLFNKACELVKEVGQQTNKLVFSDMRGKQRKFVRALSKVTNGMARQARGAARGVARSTPRLRSSFKDLNQSVQTLFQTDQKTANMAITYTFIWACMWMATYLLKQCLGTRPQMGTYGDHIISAYTVFAKRETKVQHDSARITKVAADISSHRMHRVQMGCNGEAVEAFVQGMLAIATKHRKTPGDRSVALQELSERTVTPAHVAACFHESIKTGRRHLYAFQQKALYKHSRVLVVVPDSVVSDRIPGISELKPLKLDDWNTLKTAESEETSNSRITTRVYRYVSINRLVSQLAEYTNDPDGKKVLSDLAAAHEIHFVVPPSHAEYQFVWGLFGTDNLGENRQLFRKLVWNLHLEYRSDNESAYKGTQVFEHVRTYHHLMSTTPINPGAMFAQMRQAVRKQALVTKTPDELFVELREGTHERWQGVVHEYGDYPESHEIELISIPNSKLDKTRLSELNNIHKESTKTLNKYLHQPAKAKVLSLEAQLGFAQETVIRLTEELKFKQQNARWNDGRRGPSPATDAQKARQLEQLLGHLRGFAPLQQPA